VTRRLLPALLLLTVTLVAAQTANAYPWPLKPFDSQHPIRGSFGDPRTLFEEPLYLDGINGPGSFTFHNGLDISAPDGTDVYPVVSGIAHLLDGTAVSVETLDRRVFQYFHVVPRVVDGERVRARETVLGSVEAPYGHVHLSEIDGTRITNPLLPGHLTPYRDRTRPIVDGVELRNTAGRRISPLGVCGGVTIVAGAEDTPPLPVPGTFAGLPVAPALVTWQLVRIGRSVVVPTTVVADFRRTLPPPRDFWSVYARGTYENAPRFGREQFNAMPGRFLFMLDGALDTKKLPNGLYAVHVAAKDERGNTGTLTQRFWILNAPTPSGCRSPQPPPAAQQLPPTTSTATTTTSTTVTDPDTPLKTP
jgi:hypothetical protein